MSTRAEALLEQLRKLPPEELQEVSQQLSRLLTSMPGQSSRPFPTVKVSGGTITAQHVAEALDDE